nr:caspase family protein [Pseudanabaena sp. FACHB-2040]
MGRRSFLQRLSLALTALGVGEATVSRWAVQYQAALAQPTPRKLALLIGIDQYSNQVVDPALQEVALRGAITDVELQRELLIYRFGFQPQDILTLTNAGATRQRLLEAVESHLIQQAQSGDLVLLHFSGYGSQVQIEGEPDLRRSLVPVDGILPTEENPEVRDLLQDELGVLLRSLKTNHLTTLLDAGYRDLGQVRWGTLRVRSRPTIPTGIVADERLAALPDNESGRNWPGLLLRAATPDRLALEGDWSGFSAGAFTYALTQTLWETLPSTSLHVVFDRVQEQVQRWTGPDQLPELTGNRRAETDLIPYHLPPLRPGADGIITGVNAESGTVSLWMGGLSADVLEHLQSGSRLLMAAASDVPGEPRRANTELIVQSRTGLAAAAKIDDQLGELPQSGLSVYEQVRLLPRHLDLIVALDPNLERIERVDATSALSGIPFVSFTPAGEQPADCLFGRLPKPGSATLTAALPNAANGLVVTETPDQGLERSYGLFAPNRTLVPGTLIARGEAVKTAVTRLTPHLQSLLAVKLLRLTSNPYSSQLAVRVSLESTYPQERLLTQWETLRSPSVLPKARLAKITGTEKASLQVARDDRLRYRISNFTDQALFMALVSVDSRGQFLVLMPDVPDSRPLEERQTALAESSLLPPGETRALPGQIEDWGVPATVSWVETFLVFSRAPFHKTWELLAEKDGEVAQQQRLHKLNQPLKLTRALLADLHEGAVTHDPTLAFTDQYSLHSATWATLSFRYPVLL